MKYCKIFITLACLCLSVKGNAQLSTNEQPVSFSLNLTDYDISSIQTITMPVLDMEKIEAEDKEDEKYDMPPRFGYSHKVNYDLINSGTWQELPNGDKLWQLNVVCPGALSVNISYDKFWIPEGGKFFVYSKDRKYTIGAFTNRNNKGDRENSCGFATGLVYSDDVILEYYQPKEVSSDAIISIEFIVHGYRYIYLGERGFGDSGNCMVNVNCSEGQNWQNEKKAVAMIIVNNDRFCTGSLINTTSLSGAPLFLTANHCVYPLNADTVPNLHYTFYWNYEAPGCASISVEPTPYTTYGATLIANNSSSDFALFRLSEDPINLSNYTPYYLGWDHSGDSGGPGVCIHHPEGDVKKISTVASKPISTMYEDPLENVNGTYWMVLWKETDHGFGTTQDVSSGSPLLSSDHKVIGQLHGGFSNCKHSHKTDPDWYGRFDVSWTGNNNSSFCRRLDCWLDSLNTGVQSMEGLLLIPDTIQISTDQQLYGDIRITSGAQLTIQSDIEMMGNYQVIVDSGGCLIIDGGSLSNVELVLQTGSCLIINNGGIVETRNGFLAPVGAHVDIGHGRIL